MIERAASVVVWAHDWIWHREIGKTYLKASDEARRERSVYIFGMGTVSLAISMRDLEVLGADT